MFLHIISHLLPLLLIITPESKVLTILENPAFTCLALGFIPLMIYHLFHDRNIHKKLHSVQSEVNLAKDTIRWISIAYDNEYSKKRPNWATFAMKCHMVLKGIENVPDPKKIEGSEKT
jgi:hypothetical protein